MIKKGTDKYIKKIDGSPSLYEIQTVHFVELLISLVECYQCDWKSNTQKHGWNIEYI